MADSLSKPDLGKVAVIGGAGFLGSHIVDAVYSSCKAEIYVVSRSASKYPYQHQDVKYIDADLVKTIDGVLEIESVFKQNKIDVVFHAATPPSMTAKDDQFREVNINGTKNVISAAKNSGVKALIYTSSMAVVRPSFQTGAENADESWPLFIGAHQEDSYAATKAEADQLVLQANSPGGLRTCTLRPGGMVGIRDNLVTPKICELYFDGDPNTQVGDDSALVDYGSVIDTARTHVSAAVALLRAHASPTPIPESERVDGEAFFITGEHVHFWAMTRLFYKQLGTKADKKPTVLSKNFALILARIMTFFFGLVGKKAPLTVKDVYYICAPATANNNKAKERLGYEVREPLEIAVEKACKWWLENRRPKTN